MGFFQKISPLRAVQDLRSVWRHDVPRKWLFLLLACIPPAILVTMMVLDVANKSKPLPPTVQYIESWPVDRSMTEILADRADRATIEQLRDRERRETYKALGRAFGMDVEAIEREARVSAKTPGEQDRPTSADGKSAATPNVPAGGQPAP